MKGTTYTFALLVWLVRLPLLRYFVRTLCLTLVNFNISQFGPVILVISRKIFSFAAHSIASVSLLALLALGFSTTSYAQSSRPQCSSSVVDLDGDGWGYENNRSCVMPTGHPNCSSSAILNGDGWGYENGRACIDTSHNSNTSSNSGNSSSGSQRPACTSAAIDNGDGWGWENNTSCQYRGNTSSNNNSNSSSSASSSTSGNCLLYTSPSPRDS